MRWICGARLRFTARKSGRFSGKDKWATGKGEEICRLSSSVEEPERTPLLSNPSPSLCSSPFTPSSFIPGRCLPFFWTKDGTCLTSALRRCARPPSASDRFASFCPFFLFVLFCLCHSLRDVEGNHGRVQGRVAEGGPRAKAWMLGRVPRADLVMWPGDRATTRYAPRHRRANTGHTRAQVEK